MNPEIHRDAWNKMKVTSLKFVLHHAARKLPIKSAELTKHCLRSENRLFAKMWPTVTEKLSEVKFYFQIVEIFPMFFNVLKVFNVLNRFMVFKSTKSAMENRPDSFYAPQSFHWPLKYN